jgi:hypothetical protein
MRNLFTRALKRIKQSRDTRGRLDISDEYVNWLCYAAPIVEIGSFCGLSTNLLTYYEAKNGVRNPLFTCDKWTFEGANHNSTLGDSSVTHEEYRTFVKETFIRNVSVFSRHALPHTVEILSDDFFEAWRESREVLDVFGRATRLGGPISFCYIDGNHTYEYVRRDFQNCDEFLEPRGFILFDDSADSSDWEVRQVIAEIQAAKKYECIVNNPNYLFMKK